MEEQKYRLLAVDATGGDVIELTDGSLEHCEKFMNDDLETNKKLNIEVIYTFEQLI